MEIIITEFHQGIYKKAEKRFKHREKFLAGCQAVGGKSVNEISEESGMSREYVYQQKKKVIKYAEKQDEEELEEAVLKLDKKHIERMILSLSLDCQSPASGIQRFFETVCKKPISAGYISNVLNEASKRAEKFDAQIELSGIKQGANDEIFQCGTPVIVGVDVESTYAYMLEEASDRTAETWEIYLNECKERGLELSTSINDGGTGLMAGIPKVYPEAEIQADTFHSVYEMGKEVSRIERKAYSLMKGEYALLENLESKRPRKKSKESLKEIQPKTAEAIKFYDLLFILFTWLKEMLRFSGYSKEDTMLLAQWILQEMKELAENSPGILKEVNKIQKMLPNLLSFIKRLEQGMDERSKETGIPVEAFQLMYLQLSCSQSSVQSNKITVRLVQMLMDRYTEAGDELKRLLDKTKKASSLVENLNGRIRVYMEVKRVIPTRFFVLMKVYFNTKRYQRSRCKERIGKSPLELLTGIRQPEFLEALGY